MRQLERALADLAGPDRYLFTPGDLLGVFPKPRNMTVLLSRAVKGGLLRRVCRGIYLDPRANPPRGRVLFHTAALLRANEFNYISLETALSDAGLISQIPMGVVTLMSSGRSHTVGCGTFGRIEFVHTARRPRQLARDLAYDTDCRLWRASPALALRDMRATRRSLELIDREAMHEPV